MTERTIHALDPSTVAIGWALMDRNTVLGCDVKKLEPGVSFHSRLDEACLWLGDLLIYYEYGDNEYNAPWGVALETAVIHRNPKKVNVDTTLHLAYMDGALIATALHHVSNVFEIKPGERLSALGLPVSLPRNDAKEAVRTRVNAIFNLEIPASKNDASDAIAVGMAAIKRVLEETGNW
jgi:Holliday junction resolvasome RuvABC endonuclease subunit